MEYNIDSTAVHVSPLCEPGSGCKDGHTGRGPCEVRCALISDGRAIALDES
jgi:hypothetical protein